MKQNKKNEACAWDEQQASRLVDKLPEVVKVLKDTCSTERCFEHISSAPLPKHADVVRIIELGRRILFPVILTTR